MSEERSQTKTPDRFFQKKKVFDDRECACLETSAARLRLAADKHTPLKRKKQKKAREGAETPAEPLRRFPRFLSRALYLYFILPAFPLADLSLLFSPAIPHIFVRNFSFLKSSLFSPSVSKTFAKYRQEITEDFSPFDDKK